MIINLVPQYRESEVALSKQGDTLTVNGVDFDLSAIPDGATLPVSAIDSAWFAGDVERVNGTLSVSLYLPNNVGSSALARFPGPIVDPDDGVVELPQ